MDQRASSPSPSSLWPQTPSFLKPSWASPLSPRFLTLLLLNLAAAMEKLDEALLPVVYGRLGVSFYSAPLSLASVSFFRALAQALASPFSAYLSSEYDRVHVVGVGIIWWGVASFAVGSSFTLWGVALSRTANGIGLALVLPALLSLVADHFEENARGLAFGCVQAASQGGAILGGLFGSALAAQVVMGMAGWRAAFDLVAIGSTLLGVLLLLLARDPREPVVLTPRQRRNEPRVSSAAESITETWAAAKQVLSVPTFKVILIQGVISQAPWSAMLFFATWLELIGFSPDSVLSLVSFLSLGAVLGSLTAGWVGDWASLKLPLAGRICCGQLSTAVVIPLAGCLLIFFRQSPETWEVTALLMAAIGFFSAWPSPSCNWPICSEVVPFRLRTMIFSLQQTFEKLSSAFGVPAVGLLAIQLYGFSTSLAAKSLVGHSGFEGTTAIVASTVEEGEQILNPQLAGSRNRDNEEALEKGLFLAISVPFFVNVVLITLSYWTYQKDKERCTVESWMDSVSQPNGFGSGHLGVELEPILESSEELLEDDENGL